MFKKILIPLTMLFFLASCWEESNTDSSLTLFENNDFSISIPANWEVIKDHKDTLPTPNTWSIELAVVSTNTVSWFANNLLILKADLNKKTTSKDYSMLNNLWAETDYLEYLKLSSKEITFSDKDIGILYEFEAKYNMETQKLRFLQTAHICNETKAYLITLALPTGTTDTSRYANFISSFSCK